MRQEILDLGSFQKEMDRLEGVEALLLFYIGSNKDDAVVTYLPVGWVHGDLKEFFAYAMVSLKLDFKNDGGEEMSLDFYPEQRIKEMDDDKEREKTLEHFNFLKMEYFSQMLMGQEGKA